MKCRQQYSGPLIVALMLATTVPALAQMESSGKAVGFDALIQGLSPTAQVRQTKDGSSPTIELDIHFASGTATLLPQAKSQLAALARVLQSDTLAKKSFQVVGHTDAEGGAEYNRALSAKRAEAVKNHLVRTYGIEAARLVTKGMGEDQLKNPLAPNAITNRRVEITLLGNAPAAVIPVKKSFKW